MHPERLAVVWQQLSLTAPAMPLRRTGPLHRLLARLSEIGRTLGETDARSSCGRRSSGTRHVVALRDQRRPHRPARPSDRLPVRKLRAGDRASGRRQPAGRRCWRCARRRNWASSSETIASPAMCRRPEKSRAETFADPGGGTPPLAGKARKPGTCRGSDDRTATARRAASAGHCRSPTPNSPPSPPRQ
jgi:hypothetical protein